MSKYINRREFVGLSAAALLATGFSAPMLPGEEAKSKLPQRILGRTGVKVGILGIGGAGFLTDAEDKDLIIRLINQAIDAGVNYFDTARNYGQGKSEESLGLVMGTARRKGVFLATKTSNRTYDGALKDVEASLKALRIDCLDLIQLHGFGCFKEDNVAALDRKDGVLPALRRLRDEKVVRFIGITGHPDHPKLKEAMTLYDFETLLCWVNPRSVCRWVDNELIPLAQQKKMGIVAMKAFGGGKPAGLVGEGKGKAPAPLLLRYTLSAPIAATVPAIDDRKQLEQDLEAARCFTPMSETERQALIARINLE
jgi:aryl-alcohol dehydrogenase-like predicted oxidoreductase